MLLQRGLARGGQHLVPKAPIEIWPVPSGTSGHALMRCSTPDLMVAGRNPSIVVLDKCVRLHMPLVAAVSEFSSKIRSNRNLE